jgi:hypothetical protein
VYAALLMTGAGIFAVFLFLTYFMQVNPPLAAPDRAGVPAPTETLVIT